ncbi:prepilin-type N-terminal cleavage/methylation domain-containing protein [Deltaproteobacteria bacterium TL4]
MLNPNNQRQQRSGFTLIELMVSLTVLAMVVSLLYGAFYQISNSSSQVKESLQGRQELRLLMKIVRDDLQAIRFLDKLIARNGLEGDTTVFQSGLISNRVTGPEGQEMSYIHFHSALPSRFYPEAKTQDPNLHEVGYLLEFDTTEKKWLFLRREDFFVDEDMIEGGRRHTLSEHVNGFLLEFLEQNIKTSTGETKEVWVNEWDSKDAKKGLCRLPSDRKTTSGKDPCLPVAIRLTMQLKGEDGITLKESAEINLLDALQR